MHFFEDHTWPIQQSTSNHTKHFHYIQQQNGYHTHTHCELFPQIIRQTLSNTQHTGQIDPLREQHIKYKDITSHSLLLRSKRQLNKVNITINILASKGTTSMLLYYLETFNRHSINAFNSLEIRHCYYTLKRLHSNTHTPTHIHRQFSHIRAFVKYKQLYNISPYFVQYLIPATRQVLFVLATMSQASMSTRY